MSYPRDIVEIADKIEELVAARLALVEEERDEAQNDAAGWEARCDDLEADKERLSDRIDELESNLETAETNREVEKDWTEELNDKIKELEAEITQLKEDSSVLQATLDARS